MNRRRGLREVLCARSCSWRELVGGDTIKERGGWDKEQVSRDGGAEVEDTIVITGRAADKHVFQHLFDGAGRAAVPDKIRAELAVAGTAKGHVVAEDFDFLPVFFDGRKGVVGRGGLDGAVEFDIGEFCATDDFFLGFGGELVPSVQIMEVLLDDDVASAGESGIFVTNENGVGGRRACGIFGAIHEAEEIAFVEVAEAVDFIDRGDGAFKASHDLRGELETEIHTLAADVKD